jgi:hypothetical protein
VKASELDLSTTLIDDLTVAHAEEGQPSSLAPERIAYMAVSGYAYVVHLPRGRFVRVTAKGCGLLKIDARDRR